MGLLDFFRRTPTGETEADGEPMNRKLAGLAKAASDKKAQPYDREEAIRGLIKEGTPVAAKALLKRFSLQIDPSISDQDEKQLAFDGIVSLGKGEGGVRLADVGKDPKEYNNDPLSSEEIDALRDAVVEHTLVYCKRAANLNWALKVLRKLLGDDGFQNAILKLLNAHDTEYTRNVEPKLNLLAALESVKSEAVRDASERYLEDVNETVRFHALETTFKQGNTTSIVALLTMMQSEESVRIKNKVAEGMLRLDWSVPNELQDDFRGAMQDVHEYLLNDRGEIRKA